MSIKKKSIWIIGGHSGGHLYPLFTILKKMYSKDSETSTDFIFYLPDILLSRNIVLAQNINYINHIKFMFLNYEKPNKIRFLVDSFFFFFKFFYVAMKNRPDAMYSTGGYLSIIFSLVAFFLRIPFHLYHLDSVPGKASKLMSILVSHQYILHEDTKCYLLRYSNFSFFSYPVRYESCQIITSFQAKEQLGILPSKKVIMILGGSQGAVEINDYIIDFINRILNDKKRIDGKYQYSHIEIACEKNNIIGIDDTYYIHQTGTNDFNRVCLFYQDHNIASDVFDYKDDLLLYYLAADVIISRAGAGVLAEIDFFSKCSLIIPLKGVANNHQEKNAHAFKRKNIYSKVVYSKSFFYDELLKIIK